MHQSIIQVERTDADVEEDRVVSHFLENGCGCKLKSNSKMQREEITQRRANCAEMTKAELDLVLPGKLAVSQKATHVVRRACSSFHFNGKRVCKAAFLVLHEIGEKHFKNLKKHFSENGLSSREHGNQG